MACRQWQRQVPVSVSVIFLCVPAVHTAVGVLRLFAGDDSLARAYLRARTAVNAGIGIDVVDVTLRDCAHGANRETSAASDTRVSDYVSHSS